jgi:RNA polymerase sigma factor (sigma-70 family)
MMRFDATTPPLAEPVSSGDPVLQPFLRAAGADAERHLAVLVDEHVTPIIRRVVRHQMLGRGAFRQPIEDVEDIEADGVADVLSRLADLRDGFNSEPIESFSGYVAAVAQNACHRSVRSRRPNRARLKNRLRYLFSHDPALAIWSGAAGELLCGSAAARGAGAAPDAAAQLARLAHDQPGLRHAASASGRPTEGELARFVARRLSGGVELDDLTELVADVLGISDVVRVDERSGQSAAEPQSRDPSVLTTLAERGDLRRLWQEVLELPVRQRAALLLNLRDADGSGMLGLLPLTGTATMRDIAAALGMPARELAELWGSLPIEDARIAERLGASRQQVINLRKSARERLARRIAR